MPQKIPLVDTSDTQQENSSAGVSRRKFFEWSGTSILGAAALMTGCDDTPAKISWQEQFQKHYRLMTKKEKLEAVERLEARYSREVDKSVSVDTTDAADGVLFGYALNIQKCIGCRRCVKACVTENNQSRGDGQEIEWIRVIEMAKGEFSQDNLSNEQGSDYGLQVGGHAYHAAGVVLEGDHYYQPDQVPENDSLYMPIACMQCEKPPCVKVCPVRTTYREPDGPVVIDYNWCIGCRMCIQACPYWARRFNWAEPKLPKEDMNPLTHYLGNRPRKKGEVEKCTFCIQRVRKGRYPACVEACPVGARKFGNLLDPNSEVRRVLDKKQVFRLKAEANTYPKFFYYID